MNSNLSAGKNGLSLGKKLQFGFLTCAAITLLVGWLDYSGCNQIAREAHDINVKIKQRGQFLSQSIDLARSSQVNFKKQVQEWKDLLLRGHDEADFAQYRKGFDDQEAATQESLNSLRTLLATEGIDTATLDQCIKTHLELGQRYREALNSFVVAQPESTAAVDKLVKGMDRPATEAINAVVTQVKQFNGDVTLELENSLDARTRQISLLTLLGMVVGLAASVGFGIFLTSSISRGIKTTTDILDSASAQVASAAGQLSSASQSLASGSSEQAASLEETSASLEEVSSMTRRNAQNAQAAKLSAAATRKTAELSATSTHEMGSAMNSIKAASHEMREAMNGIKAASGNVSKIIKTIDEIAFQTNILALNAAVEAARAGEAGMGFAVVADEVRNLAQRSARAAKETADMIEDSIKRSEDGVRVTEKVTGAVEEVAAKSKQLEEHLAEILTNVQQVDEQVGQIATASNEQSQGISQVSTAVSQMDKVTQGTAANAEETAAAAEELSAQSLVLKDAVRQLQKIVDGSAAVPTNDIEEARSVKIAPATARQPKPVRRQTEPFHSHNGNGNGNGHKSEIPMPAVASQRGSKPGLPSSEDFQDF